MPALGPWPQVGSGDDATSHATILLTPSNANPTTKQPPETLYYSAQPSLQTHRTSTGPNPSGVSHDSRNSLDDPLPDESHAFSNSSNASGGHLLSVVQGMHTVHAGNHAMVQTPGAHSEGPIFGVTERLIDEIDEVTQPVIPPSSSDYILVLGACAWEPATGGGRYCRTSEVVWPPPYNPNLI